MSSSTPPPPEPEPSPAEDTVSPFRAPSDVEIIADHFGVLQGYNDAQGDVLNELAVSIGELRPASAGIGSAPIGLAATLTDQVAMLRRLFEDERDYLIERAGSYTALEADDADPTRGTGDRLSSMCLARVDHLDHEMVSLNTFDRLIGQLRSVAGGSDLADVERQLDAVWDGLAYDNEAQWVRLDLDERRLIGPVRPERRTRGINLALAASAIRQWLRRQ